MSIYVNIDNSYSVDGTGFSASPYNWNQLLTVLSGNQLENEYCYLSGTRLDISNNIVISATGNIYFDSWNRNDPWIIYSSASYFWNIDCLNFYLYNGLFEVDLGSSTSNFFEKLNGSGDKSNLYINNCYIKILSSVQNIIRFSGFYILSIINSIYIDKNSSLYNSLLTYNVIYSNNIFDINDLLIQSINHKIVENIVFTKNSSIFSTYSVTWNNLQNNWTSPDIFLSSVADINISEDLYYLNSDFDTINIKGSLPNSSLYYNNMTWLDGKRDGVGCLYFNNLGTDYLLSSDSNFVDSDETVYINLSGDDPFELSATAKYYVNSVLLSSVNNDDPIEYTFEDDGYYKVTSEIVSYNEWYNVYLNKPFEIFVGEPDLTISVKDEQNKDVLSTKTDILKPLTFSATSDKATFSYFNWELGDGLSSTEENPENFYVIDGTKTINVSASFLGFSNDNIFLTASADLLVESEFNIYFVNINESYDQNTNNLGTEVDPLNWDEFKNKIESYGNFGDVYKLKGSRKITSNTLERYVLNIDKNKNFTIEDWNCFDFGPWILIIEEFTSTQNNSILSFAGCKLKNGIIYNKVYATHPSYGGKIIFGNLYDMFIVYQGNNSEIIIDPYMFQLSGVVVDISTSSSSAYNYNYCESPDWVYLNNYIEDDFRCSSCTSACIDSWWEDLENYKFVGPVDYKGYNGCVMYDTPSRYFTLTPISGDFDLEWILAASATGGNVSTHVRVKNKSTSATLQDASFNNTYIEFNSVQKTVNLFSQKAMKMRLVRNGTSTSNVSAFYWHFTEDTCATNGDLIGQWNYLNSATINVPIILEADAGDNGVGFGALKFQANDGLPYTPTISEPTSSEKPDWVTISGNSTWIEDDFETSSFNCWWNSEFKESYKIIPLSGGMVANMNYNYPLLNNMSEYDYRPLRRLSRKSIHLKGDFILESSVIFSGGDTSGAVGFAIFSADSYWDETPSVCAIPFNGIYNGSSIFEFGRFQNTIYNSTYCGVCTFSLSASRTYLKIERIDNIIRGYFKDGDDGEWSQGSCSGYYVDYDDDFYIYIRGFGKEGFEYIRLQSQSGLPNEYYEEIINVSATSGVYVKQPISNIKGSTIYLSGGDGWSDNFNEDDYDEILFEDYSVNIEDSVLVNFSKKLSNSFSACNFNIYNSTFNISESALDSLVTIQTKENNQYDWIEPIDYPFTPNNHFYLKDVSYVNEQRNYLRPFDGITFPPNPGKNYPNYENYVTGLFGYNRKDYIG